MLMLPMIQVDAFTAQPFRGNPAAVCVLDQWLDAALMQAIAMENNLSETAFCVAEEGGFGLRWFTPNAEVDLCGHATLATAHVLFTHHGVSGNELVFNSRSGPLRVTRHVDGLRLDFPALLSAPAESEPIQMRAWHQALGVTPLDVCSGQDSLLLFEDAAAVREMEPDMAALQAMPGRGVIVTAESDQPGVDIISRCFYPKLGVPEDPVTGSAHCQLMPYWAKRLGRDTLIAYQASARGGQMHCQWRGDRVIITGQAVTVMEGQWRLPDWVTG